MHAFIGGAHPQTLHQTTLIYHNQYKLLISLESLMNTQLFHQVNSVRLGHKKQ